MKWCNPFCLLFCLFSLSVSPHLTTRVNMTRSQQTQQPTASRQQMQSTPPPTPPPHPARQQPPPQPSTAAERLQAARSRMLRNLQRSRELRELAQSSLEVIRSHTNLITSLNLEISRLMELRHQLLVELRVAGQDPALPQHRNQPSTAHQQQQHQHQHPGA